MYVVRPRLPNFAVCVNKGKQTIKTGLTFGNIRTNPVPMAHLTSLKLLNVRFPTQNKTNIVQYVFVADLEFTGVARVFKINSLSCSLGHKGGQVTTLTYRKWRAEINKMKWMRLIQEEEKNFCFIRKLKREVRKKKNNWPAMYSQSCARRRVRGNEREKTG